MQEILILSFLCRFLQSICCLEILHISFGDLINIQDLRSCGLISSKSILIFPKNFLSFRLNMIEKKVIINLSSYCRKSYSSVVLCDSKVTFL